MYSQRFWKWLQIPLATLRPWRPPSSPSRRLVTRLLHPPRQQCPVLQNFSTKLQLTASISASSVTPLTKVWAPWRHTSYLSFHLHRQDFRKPNFTPKKTIKDTKNTKNVSEKVKCMQFFHSIWKNLHLTENFYTGTACGAGDKYEVWGGSEALVSKLY